MPGMLCKYTLISSISYILLCYVTCAHNHKDMLLSILIRLRLNYVKVITLLKLPPAQVAVVILVPWQLIPSRILAQILPMKSRSMLCKPLDPIQSLSKSSRNEISQGNVRESSHHKSWVHLTSLMMAGVMYPSN